jgi:D-galactarolactone cycloisomerase
VRIAEVRTYALRATIPRPFGQSQAFGNTRSAVLVEVVTDEGLSGWGECGAGRHQEPARHFVESFYRPLLLGKNPLDVERLWETCYAVLVTSGLTRGSTIQALSGVDIALWDLRGKILGQPIYQLLGGAFRERAMAYATGLYYTDEADHRAALRDEAAGYVAQGFRAVKMKIGGASPREDLRRAEAVRQAIGPDVHLMIDANQGYNVFTAKAVGRAMAALDVGWFEEPLPADDVDGYLELKASLPLALAGGEALYTRFAMREFIARRAFDIVQPDACNTGGITEFRRIAALASTWGVQVNPHVWGTPVALATGLHLIAALPPTPHCRVPTPFYQEPVLEFDQTPNPLRTDLAVAPFRLHEGYLDVPQGPGLGITLDRRAIEHYCLG